MATVWSEGPLSGIRVVEFGTFVAVPFAGLTLAQLGAEVIRVDPIGGAADINRWPLAGNPAKSLYWAGLNKGKHSLALNIRSPEGQRLLSDLIVDSTEAGGIFITNAVGQDWLADELLRSKRPDLLHVHVVGYPDGSAAVDYTVNAELGFPYITGPIESPDPVNHVLPAWDIATGLYAALAIICDIRSRSLTGKGAFHQIALWDVALGTAGHLGYLAEAQLNGRRERAGNYIFGSFGVDFRSKDGDHVMVVALTTRHWRDLVSVTGFTELFERLAEQLNANFDNEGDRFIHREVLAALLRTWFEKNSTEEIATALASTSVLWSRYRHLDQLLEELSTGTVRGDLLKTIYQPGIGNYLAPSSPLNPSAIPQPAPILGQHSTEVLEQILGLSSPRVSKLIEAGIVGSDEVN